MAYKVKLNFFEGPLDLLLFLIRRERIDIYDIPIAKITEQYLSYMEVIKMLDLDIAGDFLVMAATLMHIKSKMLLPVEEEEGEQQEEDPREELVRRLLEYKKYKEAAGSLKEMMDYKKGIFVHKGSGKREKLVVDDGDIYFEASLFDLITAFKTVLTNVTRQHFHEVIKDRFTVGEKIEFILNKLNSGKQVIFSHLFEGEISKDELIATFMALLELMKMKAIAILQKEHLGEIYIFPRESVKEKNN